MLIINVVLTMVVAVVKEITSDSRLNFGQFGGIELDDTLLPQESIFVVTDLKRILRNFLEEKMNNLRVVHNWGSDVHRYVWWIRGWGVYVLEAGAQAGNFMKSWREYLITEFTTRTMCCWTSQTPVQAKGQRVCE